MLMDPLGILRGGAPCLVLSAYRQAIVTGSHPVDDRRVGVDGYSSNMPIREYKLANARVPTTEDITDAWSCASVTAAADFPTPCEILATVGDGRDASGNPGAIILIVPVI